MKNKALFLLLVAGFLVFSLTGCVQSASTPIPAQALAQGETTLFPISTQLGPTMDTSHLQQATAAIIPSGPTPTPEIIIPTATGEAPAQPEITNPESTVIVPTATEIPKGGCSPSVEPYPGLGPGQPTFGICGVVKGINVTIRTNDFFADQNYTVYMRDFNAPASDEIEIGSFSSNEGGQYEETYTIPDQLKGLNVITIRVVFAGGWTSYNYFYNISTD